MSIINKILEDYQRAGENFEHYQKMQKFFKGQHSRPQALIDFMHFDYLPKPLIKLIEFNTKYLNKFFNWWLDFHRLSFLTVLMICAIIYLVFGK